MHKKPKICLFKYTEVTLFLLNKNISQNGLYCPTKINQSLNHLTNAKETSALNTLEK